MAKISTYASKTTPVDADSVVAIDSAASNATKRFTWANIKAAIKTYYDSVSATLTTKTIALGSNTVTGTKAQFDTAVTDGNFLYVGDVSLASTTEVLTGTDAAKSVTPDALAALWEKGSNVASAGTVSLGEGGFFHITGTTTITDIDPATDKAGRPFVLCFDGVLTLTHNASTLILPTGGNITTAAGDMAYFISEGSDAVRCVYYTGKFLNVRAASGSASSVGIGFADATGFYRDGGALMRAIVAGSEVVQFMTNGLNLESDNIVGWTASTLALSPDTGLARLGAAILKITDGSTGGGALGMQEVTAPAAPATNNMYTWIEDNGSGKTRWMCRFGSGAAIQIAIEP